MAPCSGSSFVLGGVAQRSYCVVKPKDTKAAFQAGNVAETISKWERDANVADLNLITEKLGIDRKKYKDISVQMNDIITLRTKLLGNSHPETIYSNAILSAVYRVVGKYASAINIIKQCLSLTETLIQEHDDASEHSLSDLYQLYASCLEEYARVLKANKENESALSSLKHGIAVLEHYCKDSDNVENFAVHFTLLHKLVAESSLELNKYQEAKEALAQSTQAAENVKDGVKLKYYLLNHWQDESTAAFHNHTLRSKLHSRLSEWEAAEQELQSAWKVAVENKGRQSIECCNAFLELLDFYGDLVSTRISEEEYVRLLTQALQVGKKTDAILRKTRGLDKRIKFPYYPMIQRGLKTLLPKENQKAVVISLLYECLRIHEKYPAIYPTNDEDVFTKVMSLVQLLREDNQFEAALELITTYKDQFLSLKEKNPTYVIPLVEVQAQLIISSCYGADTESLRAGDIPLTKQLEITNKTREAVEGLEYVSEYYAKKKNIPGRIKSLHTLAIVETLQEEYSYADRDAFRCIKLIDPNFKEYANRIERSESIPLNQVARYSDLLMLRGSVLRILHESSRSIQHYKAALELLSISRDSLAKNSITKIKDDLSRASDILRCLDSMMDISESTLSEQKANNAPEAAETERFLQTCKEHYNSAQSELNRLHVRLEKKQSSAHN